MKKEKTVAPRNVARTVMSCKALIPARNEGDTLCVCVVTGIEEKEGKFGPSLVIKGECFMRSPDGVILNAKKLYVPSLMNDEFDNPAAFAGRRIVFIVQTSRNDDGKLRVTGYCKKEGFNEGGCSALPPEFDE